MLQVLVCSCAYACTIETIKIKGNKANAFSQIRLPSAGIIRVRFNISLQFIYGLLLVKLVIPHHEAKGYKKSIALPAFTRINYVYQAHKKRCLFRDTFSFFLQTFTN